MGWWSALFSAPKIVETGCEVVKSGMGMLDNAFYTAQEKTADMIEASKIALERVKLALSESSVRSITRRFLSFAIIGQCMFLTNVAAVLYLAKKVDDAGFILELLKFWSVPLASVVIFYFGYYGVQQIFKSKNGN
jgi:hypothetical protein